MKKIFMLITILILACNVYAKNNPWEQKLPFKEATINYNISGSESGTQILYVKDYGNSTSKYKKTSVKMFGMTQPAKETLDIVTPEWVYSVDLTERKASKSVNPIKYMIEEYNKLSGSDKKKAMKNAEKMGVGIIQDLNGEVKKGAANILGYKCDMATVLGATVYTISDSNVELKSSANIMGISMNMVATQINKGGVPSDKFKVPSGIEVTYSEEADRYARQQAKSTIDMLVNGNSSGSAKNKNGEQPSENDIKNIMNMFGGQPQ